MGRSLRVTRPHRALYHNSRYRFAAIVFFLLLIFKQHYLFFRYREALAAKYSPTEFPSTFEQQSLAVHTDFQGRLLANRAGWTPLREGYEGKTFIFEDSVIKTFTPGRSPFRNCVSDSANEFWPTEISASLYFGGSHLNSTYPHNGFLPVKSFFMAVSSSSQAEWHLVTPLVKGGSLQNLAAETRTREKTCKEVDEQYRPAFNSLLGSLQVLHEAGYCHDDIKPGNIFVADETRWIVGDLGNLRHVLHPYHFSLLWKENKQLPDCRDNDVFRALKTYLHFIHDAAADKASFNSDFFENREPLSRLFWSVANNVTRFRSAEPHARLSVIGQSHNDGNDTCEDGALAAGTDFTWLSITSRKSALDYAVVQALQTRMGDKMARWWGLTWLFGVPVTSACGV